MARTRNAAANRAEAALVPGVDVFPAVSLPQAVDLVVGLLAAPDDRPRPCPPLALEPPSRSVAASGIDLSPVPGQ